MENSSQIGRVYKMNWRGWAFPVLVLALGTCTTVGFLTGALQPGRRFGMFGSASLLLGGGLLVLGAFSARIILTEDAIEERSLFRKNRVSLNEIRGRRVIIGPDRLGFLDGWRLEPEGSKARPIDINNFFTLDAVFYEWMDQIPNLDEEDVD